MKLKREVAIGNRHFRVFCMAEEFSPRVVSYPEQIMKKEKNAKEQYRQQRVYGRKFISMDKQMYSRGSLVGQYKLMAENILVAIISFIAVKNILYITFTLLAICKWLKYSSVAFVHSHCSSTITTIRFWNPSIFFTELLFPLNCCCHILLTIHGSLPPEPSRWTLS